MRTRLQRLHQQIHTPCTCERRFHKRWLRRLAERHDAVGQAQFLFPDVGLVHAVESVQEFSHAAASFSARGGHKLVSVTRSPTDEHSLGLLGQECGQALQVTQGTTAILVEPFGRPCRIGVKQHPIQCRQPGTVQGGRQATCPIVQRTGLSHFFRVRGKRVGGGQQGTRCGWSKVKQLRMLPGHASVFQLPPQHLDILRCHRSFLKRVAPVTQHQHILCKEAVRGHYHVVRSVNEVSGSVKLCLIFTPFGTASCRREKENSSNQEGRPPRKETCHLQG